MLYIYISFLFIKEVSAAEGATLAKSNNARTMVIYRQF